MKIRPRLLIAPLLAVLALARAITGRVATGVQRVGEGTAPIDPPGATPPGGERRGPNRATNVTRLPPRANAPIPAPAAAPVATGSDDWEAF